MPSDRITAHRVRCSSTLRRRSNYPIAILALAIVLVGCGGGVQSDPLTPTTTSLADGTSTVEINGKSYTCESITTSVKCSGTSQTAFNRYKNNIDKYVQSDKFGPFNDADYADLALMGLFACTYRVGEQQKYLTLVRSEAPDLVKNADDVALLPIWFRAHSVLCPVGRGDVQVPI